MQTHFFPFGEPLRKVVQMDRTPKRVFVLGVYASAVHAQWVDASNHAVVKALAVASEPCIFWNGDNAEAVISRIKIPRALGELTLPADPEQNGGSGRVLDESYLKPLGLEREDAWLCDLIPESRMNRGQRTAIKRAYEPVVNKYHLQPATVPVFVKSEFISPDRAKQILEELESSHAETLILLGDLPIRWFLGCCKDEAYSRLAQFGETEDAYGREHEMKINGRPYNVIPLCHPRQAGGLGKASDKWRRLHDQWAQRVHPQLQPVTA